MRPESRPFHIMLFSSDLDGASSSTFYDILHSHPSPNVIAPHAVSAPLLGTVCPMTDNQEKTIKNEDGGTLVVVVFMCVTSVLICRRILPRFCSGEFFAFCWPFIRTTLHIVEWQA